MTESERQEFLDDTARMRGITGARIGGQVKVDGKPGVILGANMSGNFDVRFEDGRVGNVAPGDPPGWMGLAAGFWAMTRKVVFTKPNYIAYDRLPLNASTLSLIDHLRSGGSVPPIHCCRDVYGRLHVRDGRHRLLAHMMLERDIMIRVSDRPLTPP